MKIRNIVYGYGVVDGNVIVQPAESKIVLEIYEMYLIGKSMLQIADVLNERRIEYMPSVISWNKARVMRILEDTRYLGDDKYPTIIEKDVHDKIQKVKFERNDQKGVDRQSDIFQLSVPVRCPICNSIMKRRKDTRRRISSRWTCKNNDCSLTIGKTDENLIAEITELLNILITNPFIIETPTEQHTEPSIELIRLNNEITRLINTPQIDRDVARGKIMDYLALKYKESNLAIGVSQRLMDTFKEAIPLKKFCPHLFERTVDEIKLYADKTVGLILTNGQEIKKGDEHGTT